MNLDMRKKKSSLTLSHKIYIPGLWCDGNIQYLWFVVMEVIKRYVILFVATDIQPIVSVYAGP